MTNLWEETVRKLADRNLNFDRDVVQVQTCDGYINKELFKMQAMATNYDAGFGAAEIREDLVIVGKNWWLERREYDGSEWWVFRTMPELLENDIGIAVLTTNDYYEDEEE